MAPVPAPRRILHLDMDAFFASIEQLDFPHLRGKPLLVGHDGPRGVVCTASYEARPFGCHSAQPMSVAKRLCPQAIVVPVRGGRYREVSQRMFAILDAFSPLIEPLSVDEAFIDASGSERLWPDVQAMARQIKDRIRDELHLTASVGIGPNKFLAKLASDLEKPDGLTVINAGDVQRVLSPLPIGKLWGVGPATAGRFETLGIRTIGDLRAFPLDSLRQRLGDEAQHFHNLAFGRDDRPVTPDRQAKSIGQEQTFERDVAQVEEVRRVLLGQCEQVARRLRREGFHARTVTVKIRYGDFQTITRAVTLKGPTCGTEEIWAAARGVFDAWAGRSFAPVRLIGVTASQLSLGAGQLGLFEEARRDRNTALDATADAIVKRFGKGAIKRGGTLSDADGRHNRGA